MGVEGTIAQAADLLVATLPEAVEEVSAPHGDVTVLIRPAWLKRAMEFLKNDSRLRFDLLVDVTAVDYLGRSPRFEVVYHLLSMTHNRRVRIKLCVDGDQPVVESITDLWGSANWLEREVWDMFGIRFAGHPNLKRILLYEEFEGHPLRKDYPMRRRQPLIGPKS